MNKEKTRKTKTQKGITLVALIITIIVLLILAVVAIKAVIGDGILSHAKNARSEYQLAGDNESTTLDSYLAQLDDATKVKWTQNKTTVTNGDITLEVGDYVDYKANVSGYTDKNGWRVLGAENGELLLISSSNVVSSYSLDGDKDYLNNVGIGKLNTACEPYKNVEYATTARSVKAEDINRVTGYDPTKTGNGNPYGSGQVCQYGNKVRYSLVKNDSGAVTGVKYEYGYDEETKTYTKSDISTNYTSFMKPEESTNITGSYTVEKSTCYSYYPHSLTTLSSTTGDCKGISTSSNAYSTLFSNTSYSSGAYWLASSCIEAGDGYVWFGFESVAEENVSIARLWDSTYGRNGTNEYGIRAVISIKSDIKLTPNGANSWKLSK